MRLRIPLYGKILSWFLLNLALLALLLFGVLRSQFKLEPLLAATAGDRVQHVADQVMNELHDQPRKDWDAVLADYSNHYGVEFSIFQESGQHIAGKQVQVPREMLSRLRNRPGPPPNGRRAGEAFPQPEGPESPDVRENFGPDNIGPRRFPDRAGAPPRFFGVSEKPTRYWAILPFQAGGPRNARPQPLRLAMVSNTLSANGLFLDLNPWLWGGGLVLLISALWWIPFVASISRSINQMKLATEQIAAGRFDMVLAEKRRDELGQLGEAINHLAKRLEGFVTGQKRFLGDTAHELCAPIARLQMALGVLEHRADPAQQQQIDDLREELEEMSSLVNELLSFSKAGLRAKDVESEVVSLKQTVRNAIRKESSETDQIIDEVPEELCVLAEPELLTRAVANVLRNAIRYAGAKGPIRLSALESGSHVELTIEDEGPGVPEAALSRIFDPFFRLDPSRTRETGGAGLGLAIVKTCVESCRGSVRAVNKSPQGLAVKIELIRAA